MRKHGAPCVPVVRPLLAPDIQLIPDVFIVKYFGKATVCSGIFMGAAAREYVDMAAAAYLFEYVMIGEVRYIMLRTVEVYVFVVVALCIFGKVIHAAHRNYSIYKVRPFQKKIHAM